MRPLKFAAIPLLLLAAYAACTPKNPGSLTLVNSGIDGLKISVDGRTFTVMPSNHITKYFASGRHEIRINGADAVEIDVERNKTTLFDSTGLSCYVVADYSPRYRGMEPVIVEKFRHQRVFTTSETMITSLGSFLPKELKPGERALRLQQIDCEVMDDDKELVESIANFQ